jgi:broad specificity phosphatase PhoE
LDERGDAQAVELIELLAPLLGDDPDLRTSPALRCRRTVAPLAARLGTTAVVDDGLIEGCDVAALLSRIEMGIERPSLWSSHGDVIPALLDMLARRGVDLGPAPRVQRASTWVLDVEDGEVLTARYLAPPG